MPIVGAKQTSWGRGLGLLLALGLVVCPCGRAAGSGAVRADPVGSAPSPTPEAPVEENPEEGRSSPAEESELVGAVVRADRAGKPARSGGDRGPAAARGSFAAPVPFPPRLPRPARLDPFRNGHGTPIRC